MHMQSPAYKLTNVHAYLFNYFKKTPHLEGPEISDWN